jgi:hypothetical protein
LPDVVELCCHEDASPAVNGNTSRTSLELIGQHYLLAVGLDLDYSVLDAA